MLLAYTQSDVVGVLWDKVAAVIDTFIVQHSSGSSKRLKISPEPSSEWRECVSYYTLMVSNAWNCRLYGPCDEIPPMLNKTNRKRDVYADFPAFWDSVEQ